MGLWDLFVDILLKCVFGIGAVFVIGATAVIVALLIVIALILIRGMVGAAGNKDKEK